MPKFPMTYCSQCGAELGPGDAGVSRCSDHAAKPHDQAWREGIEAAASLLDAKADAYDAEHGSTDPETGTREYPGRGAGQDYHSNLIELAEEIRALATPNTQG